METTNRIRISRVVFLILAAAFALSIAAQVFLAGFAIFVDPARWSMHTLFVKIFEYLPLFMLLFSFLGQLSKSMRWLSFGLFLLIMAMYATSNMTSSVPLAGAFHPVLALIIFWLSVSIVRKAWRMVYS